MKPAAELLELIGLVLLIGGAFAVHPGLAFAIVGIVFLAAATALRK